MTEALEPTKPKIFATWPFLENVCRAWHRPLCPFPPSLPSCPLLNNLIALFTVAQTHQAHWGHTDTPCGTSVLSGPFVRKTCPTRPPLCFLLPSGICANTPLSERTFLASSCQIAAPCHSGALTCFVCLLSTSQSLRFYYAYLFIVYPSQ